MINVTVVVAVVLGPILMLMLTGVMLNRITDVFINYKLQGCGIVVDEDAYEVDEDEDAYGVDEEVGMVREKRRHTI